MIKVLNLYAGLGGNRKYWTDCEVTAIENNEKIAGVYSSLYPKDTVLIEDAHDYLLKHHKEFDFIWSSPPCQSHSKMVKATRHNIQKYPDLDLYQEIILLRDLYKNGKWVVENVNPYYEPLIPFTEKVGRHLFWSNFNFKDVKDVKRPSGFINKSNVDGKKELMDWLGIYYEENIYYNGNHCPAQILRNCIHPKIGLEIYNSVN